MPIRGFDQFMLTRSLQRLPMKVLEDTIIAFDGFWFFKKYLAIPNREAFLDPTAAIEKCIEPLAVLSNVNILWIWDGMDYAKAAHGREYEHSELAIIDEALRSPEECRGLKNLVDPENLVESATRILRARGITVVRAPYSAMGQCVYFLREKYVSYIFTKTDALLFPQGAKIITGFNFIESTLEIADRARLFDDFEFNLHGFQSFAFLCGCELCPTVPSHAANFSAPSIAELAAGKNLEQHLLGFYMESGRDEAAFDKSDESRYLWRYYRSFMCIDFHPVMTRNGRVECLSGADIPADLECIFGKVLQDVVYQQLFTCEITPRLLNRYAFDKEYAEPHYNEILTIFRKIYTISLPAASVTGRSDSAGMDESWEEGPAPLHNDARPGDKSEHRVGDQEADGLRRSLAELSTSAVVEKLLGLKLARSSTLNPLLQMVVLKLARMDFDPADLLCLLNARSSAGAEMRCDLSRATSGLYCFYAQANEYIRIIKDLVAFISLHSAAQQNLAVSLCFGDFLAPWKKDQLEKFIKSNLANEHRLLALLEVLR